MNRTSAAVLLALLSIGIVNGKARAEDTGPCSTDIAAFCQELPPGDSRIDECLEEHDAQLSPACKLHREELLRKARRAPRECRQDVEQFCMDVRPINRRIMRCLLQNLEGLSNGCRQQLDANR